MIKRLKTQQGQARTSEQGLVSALVVHFIFFMNLLEDLHKTVLTADEARIKQKAVDIFDVLQRVLVHAVPIIGKVIMSIVSFCFADPFSVCYI